MLYTDGITEARKPDGAFFGTEQLEQLVTTCSADAQAIVKAIVCAVDKWTDYASVNDDRTLVVAKIE